jgi:hypothetical protein
VLIEIFVGNRLKFKSFRILKYFPVNKESFFLNGSNLIELKLKLYAAPALKF